MAQAFVGSNPTSRTTTSTSRIFVDFESFLTAKRVRGNSLSETTIESKAKIVSQLSHHVNLWDTESVRDYLERSKWVNGRKNLVLFTYSDWCTWNGFDFKIDKYHEEDSKIPFIPREEQLDALIGQHIVSPS